MITPEYTLPEHLGDPYLGAWYVADAMTDLEAATVIEEVESSGKVEGIRHDTQSSTAQVFRRLVIDLRKEHDFPRVEALGQKLASYAIVHAGVQFPNMNKFRIDEATVQIYPPGEKLALGWHKDHKDDPYMVISAVLMGGGTISFTEKEPFKDATDDDVIAAIRTRALGAVYFRSNGLYERADGSDIRVAHAVTSIDPGEERFTIQYRMNANAAIFGNTHVNADRPWRHRP